MLAHSDSGSLLIRLALDLLADMVRHIDPAQIETGKFACKEGDLFVDVQMFVDQDPPGLHHPARPALGRPEVVIGDPYAQRRSDMLQFC